MIVRTAVILILAHLLVTEVVLQDTTLGSELNWWSYMVRRDIGFDRLEDLLEEVNRR